MIRDRRPGLQSAFSLMEVVVATAIFAGAIIAAAPRFVAARVVAPWRERRPKWLRAFNYGPWVVATLTVREPP